MAQTYVLKALTLSLFKNRYSVYQSNPSSNKSQALFLITCSQYVGILLCLVSIWKVKALNAVAILTQVISMVQAVDRQCPEPSGSPYAHNCETRSVPKGSDTSFEPQMILESSQKNSSMFRCEDETWKVLLKMRIKIRIICNNQWNAYFSKCQILEFSVQKMTECVTRYNKTKFVTQ